MQKQVNKDHYDFSRYVKKPRWASIWHQLDEVNKLKPNKILEIGPGNGIFKATATLLGMNVETLDIDPDLKPDHICSVFEMPFENNSFDVVCAFQMLEHLLFEKSLKAFAEMNRVAKNAVVISLPDSKPRLHIAINISQFKLGCFYLPLPRLHRPIHKFDGEHYWEINKVDYSLKHVISLFQKNTKKNLINTFCVDENPYHRFFIWR